MSVKERLIKFIETLGLSQAQFEQACVISNGYINNIRNSVGPKVLAKIEKTYPQLNKIWLLHGQDEMLNQNSKVFSLNYDNTIKEALTHEQDMIKKQSLSDETIRDLARSGVILADANKTLADNNKDLIQMFKSNSVAPPKISELLYPFLGKISKAVAEKYSLKSDDVLVELGRLLLEDLLGKKGPDIVPGERKRNK